VRIQYRSCCHEFVRSLCLGKRLWFSQDIEFAYGLTGYDSASHVIAERSADQANRQAARYSHMQNETPYGRYMPGRRD